MNITEDEYDAFKNSGLSAADFAIELGNEIAVDLRVHKDDIPILISEIEKQLEFMAAER